VKSDFIMSDLLKKKEELLFPYEVIRKKQDELMLEVEKAIINEKTLLVHAPTGIGKTAAVLSPAISLARKGVLSNDGLTVFFLTSRHTQHKIVINTIKAINEKHGLRVTCADIIGKQSMCPLPVSDSLTNHDFNEFCKALKQDLNCEFYNNTRNEDGITSKAKQCLHELTGVVSVEEVIKHCLENKLCSYEIGLELCKKANVIICDYYHVFHPLIRTSLFFRINKSLDECIIIVDEAHNLYQRVRDLMSVALSSYQLTRASNEAKKFGEDTISKGLEVMNDLLYACSQKVDDMNETRINAREFNAELSKRLNKDVHDFLSELISLSEVVRKERERSYCGGVAYFLDAWLNEDEESNFIRLLRKKGDKVVLHKTCLDASRVCDDVFSQSRSNVLMSGTLTPLRMHADLLGLKEAVLKEYSSPFPPENRLTLIVPRTTTRYSKRNHEEFKRIAAHCSAMVNACPSNSAIYFPSYYLRDAVYEYLRKTCSKKILLEKQGMSKDEKNALFQEFKSYKDVGACLMGCIRGSFSEGVDLPGKTLELIIIVGIPLSKPNLETRALINYFDEKFGNGWNYAYVYPAINKTIQAAGRAVRSETDKGVIVFLDERYAWKQYYSLFPKEWNVRITEQPVNPIREFFNATPKR